MSGTILQLRSHEVWRALEVVDPVEMMAEYLISRTVGAAGHRREPPGRLVSWRGAGRNGTELVLLDHPDATGPCVLPAPSLRGSQVAGLAAVAAREMLMSGGVTMAVLGPVESTQPQLAVMARHVPDLSHVALFCGTQVCLADLEPGLVDQLDLSGIQLSVARSVADAVFGANLVIATDDDADATTAPALAELSPNQLARGALLINATGVDLPADLVGRVAQVFVDDLALLADYPDRHVAGGHADAGIAGDLAQLLTGQHKVRRHAGDLVLVELLGVHELNADLAFRIYEVATQTGLGVRIAN